VSIDPSQVALAQQWQQQPQWPQQQEPMPPQWQQQVPDPLSMMPTQCRACGQPLPDGTLACGRCGRPVAPPEWQQQQQQPMPQWQQPMQDQQAAMQYQQAPSAPAKVGLSAMRVMGFLTIVLGFAIAGVGCIAGGHIVACVIGGALALLGVFMAAFG
jgi:hypothetical protein